MAYTTLYQQIFGEQFSDSGMKNHLEEIVQKYPWFSLVHFYRLKATGLTEKQFKTIAPLTALHFNNVFLLNQRLHQKTTPIESIPEQVHEIDHPLPIIEPVTDNRHHAIEAEPEVPDEIPDENLPEMENKEPIENLRVDFQSSDAPSEEPLFEPLHASDYFASQGIKLSEAAIADDKLGEQMKRFTDWLKTMKKTPMQADNVSTNKEDVAITALADKSNRETEIITEAMAQVFEQQHKFEKAKDIYKKLSLINPDKSAYFAAKIENLNNK